jgi:DNA polymerase II small subunit/DNA polymerase delta subunit B
MTRLSKEREREIREDTQIYRKTPGVYSEELLGEIDALRAEVIWEKEFGYKRVTARESIISKLGKERDQLRAQLEIYTGPGCKFCILCNETEKTNEKLRERVEKLKALLKTAYGYMLTSKDVGLTNAHLKEIEEELTHDWEKEQST